MFFRSPLLFCDKHSFKKNDHTYDQLTLKTKVDLSLRILETNLFGGSANNFESILSTKYLGVSQRVIKVCLLFLLLYIHTICLLGMRLLCFKPPDILHT